MHDPDYNPTRRRSEDVYKVIEDDIFPRIINLEVDVKKLATKGCALRNGDMLRTQTVEASLEKIVDKIDKLGERMAEARVGMAGQVGEIKINMEKQIGSIRTWVLTGVVIILLSVAGFFLQKHYEAAYDWPPAIHSSRP